MEFVVNKDAVLERFLRYVQVDSETGNELEMAQILEKDLKDLGFDVTTDNPPEWVKTNGFNVYGTLKGDETLEPILFCCHMDTVVPGIGVKPQVDPDGYVRSDGTTVLGGDDKAGVAAVIEAALAAKDLPRRPTVEVIFTVREEGGLWGAKGLDYSRVLSKRAVVLDSGGGPERITTTAPGQNKITVLVHGKRAHAGIAPEEGISAIQVAAKAVAEMNLLRIDEETTCNIGTFTAVGPTNIVSPEAKLVFEVRSLDMKKLQAQTDYIIKTIEKTCQDAGISCDAEVETAFEGFVLPDDHKLVQQTIKAVKAVGLEPVTVGSGGGSDANVFNGKGITTVNLGIGMEKVHTTAEQQNILQMWQGSEICYQMILQYSE